MLFISNSHYYAPDKSRSIPGHLHLLLINNNHFYVPVKLRSISGHLHVFTINGELEFSQIYIRKNLLSVVLQMNLHNVKIPSQDKPLHIPHSILIALKDNFGVHNCIGTGTCIIHLMIKQGANWYFL